MKPLVTKEYRTVSYVSGPLIFVERPRRISYGEVAAISLPDGEQRTGQVLDISREVAIVQVYEGTNRIDDLDTRVRFTGEPQRIDVSIEMLGRVFDGLGRPRDGRPPVVPQERPDINGTPINPYTRDKPADFVQTGVSAIDALNTLVRGQKLPIFSGAGLPANRLAAQITRQSKVLEEESNFAVVFAAMGITWQEA